MQIFSANPGSISRSRQFANSGQYPAVQPSARNPAIEPGVESTADVSSAKNARALQQVAQPVELANADVARELVLARRRADFDRSVDAVQTDQPGNKAAIQRAVATYHSVATQEQRFELTGVLAGIDVFA